GVISAIFLQSASISRMAAGAAIPNSAGICSFIHGSFQNGRLVKRHRVPGRIKARRSATRCRPVGTAPSIFAGGDQVLVKSRGSRCHMPRWAYAFRLLGEKEDLSEEMVEVHGLLGGQFVARRWLRR